jgi:hypothetical protein
MPGGTVFVQPRVVDAASGFILAGTGRRMPALSLLAVVALAYMLVSRLDQRWAGGAFRSL